MIFLFRVKFLSESSSLNFCNTKLRKLFLELGLGPKHYDIFRTLHFVIAMVISNTAQYF